MERPSAAGAEESPASWLDCDLVKRRAVCVAAGSHDNKKLLPVGRPGLCAEDGESRGRMQVDAARVEIDDLEVLEI